tara:strand:- start:1177 stop:1437 length:261 start_codon:yes stop_codon:yes gene_type:complete
MEENNDMREVAAHFLRTNRGQYIMGQALSVAINSMNKVAHSRRETSNIEDMQFLLDHLFPMGKLATLKEIDDLEKQLRMALEMDDG